LRLLQNSVLSECPYRLPTRLLPGVHPVAEVEDHHDAAALALHRGRDTGVAPVEIEAMGALAVGLPAGDSRGFAGRHVIDAEPTTKIFGRRVLVGVIALD